MNPCLVECNYLLPNCSVFSRELRVHMQMAVLEVYMQFLSSENCAEKTDNMFFLSPNDASAGPFHRKLPPQTQAVHIKK